MSCLSATERSLASHILLQGTDPLHFRRAVLSTTTATSTRALREAGISCLNPKKKSASSPKDSSGTDPSPQKKKKVENPTSTPPLPRITFTDPNVIDSWSARIASPGTALTGCTLLSRSRGLTNEGNTCFLNSMMQCLAHSDLFVMYAHDHGECAENQGNQHVSINSNRTKNYTSTSALHRNVWEVVRGVRCALIEAESSARTYRPRSFLRALHLVSRSLRLGRQEDSHEFLVSLLDSLQTQETKGVFADFASLQTTGVSRLFCGWMRGRVQWKDGVSDVFEPYSVWSLELTGPTLVQCIESTQQREVLRGDNAYRTPDHKYVEAQRWLQPYSLPPVLILHLKRFRHDMHHRAAKIQKSVTFPIHLNLSDLQGGEQAKISLKYELFAVNVHAGSQLSCGHYFSYCKNALNGSWFRCDDETVTACGEDEVLGTQAYILFYRRIPTEQREMTTATKRSHSTQSLGRAHDFDENEEGAQFSNQRYEPQSPTSHFKSPVLNKKRLPAATRVPKSLRTSRGEVSHLRSLVMNHRLQNAECEGDQGASPTPTALSLTNEGLPSSSPLSQRSTDPHSALPTRKASKRRLPQILAPMPPIDSENQVPDPLQDSATGYWDSAEPQRGDRRSLEGFSTGNMVPNLGQVRDEEWEGALDSGRRRKKGKSIRRQLLQEIARRQGNVFQAKARNIFRQRRERKMRLS